MSLGPMELSSRIYADRQNICYTLEELQQKVFSNIIYLMESSFSESNVLAHVHVEVQGDESLSVRFIYYWIQSISFCLGQNFFLFIVISSFLQSYPLEIKKKQSSFDLIGKKEHSQVQIIQLFSAACLAAVSALWFCIAFTVAGLECSRMLMIVNCFNFHMTSDILKSIFYYLCLL